jgi:hypothetical protein
MEYGNSKTAIARYTVEIKQEAVRLDEVLLPVKQGDINMLLQLAVRADSRKLGARSGA